MMTRILHAQRSRSTAAFICLILAVVAIATPETLLKGVPPLPWIVVASALAFAAAYFAVARSHVFAIIGVVALLWSGMIIITVHYGDKKE